MRKVWCDNAGEPEEKAEVEVSMQEAADILTAATKGCGSYAKPILRHITTVADFAKLEGIQVNAVLCSFTCRCCVIESSAELSTLAKDSMMMQHPSSFHPSHHYVII